MSITSIGIVQFRMPRGSSEPICIGQFKYNQALSLVLTRRYSDAMELYAAWGPGVDAVGLLEIWENQHHKLNEAQKNRFLVDAEKSGLLVFGAEILGFAFRVTPKFKIAYDYLDAIGELDDIEKRVDNENYDQIEENLYYGKTEEEGHEVDPAVAADWAAKEEEDGSYWRI